MFSRKSNGDAQAQLEAINRSQAVIEFNVDGTIITANKLFLNALGYRLEEIQGKRHSMFVPSDQRDSADYRAFWAALGRGEFQAAEYKRIAKGGREVWIQASYNPVLGKDKKPVRVVKFATDITKHKIRSMADAGKIAAINRSQAVIEFNLDGTIVTANENFLKTLGYALGEIQGKHHSLFVTPAERDSAAYREFWAALNRGDYQAGDTSGSARVAGRFGSKPPITRSSTRRASRSASSNLQPTSRSRNSGAPTLPASWLRSASRRR